MNQTIVYRTFCASKDLQNVFTKSDHYMVWHSM